MTEPGVAISLQGVRKSFGDVRAVDGISLDIADGEFITERDLAVSMPPPASTAEAATAAAPSPEPDLLANVERDHIQRALMRAGGNKKAAAQMLGLSRRALYRRLERLDLSATISRRRQSVMAGA